MGTALTTLPLGILIIMSSEREGVVATATAPRATHPRAAAAATATQTCGGGEGARNTDGHQTFNRQCSVLHCKSATFLPQHPPSKKNAAQCFRAEAEAGSCGQKDLPFSATPPLMTPVNIRHSPPPLRSYQHETASSTRAGFGCLLRFLMARIGGRNPKDGASTLRLLQSCCHPSCQLPHQGFVGPSGGGFAEPTLREELPLVGT